MQIGIARKFIEGRRPDNIFWKRAFGGNSILVTALQEQLLAMMMLY